MVRRTLTTLFLTAAALSIPTSMPAMAGEAGSASGGTAIADFDGDSFADLAIGVASEDVGAGPVNGAGAVNVLYGSAGGLTADGDDFFTQEPLTDGAQEGDNFGGALAAGDFDGDTFADLAIGVPGEDVGTQTDAGAVNVLYGTSTGLSTTGSQYWTELLPGGDAPEPSDFFGFSLAVGDLDGDGYDDLAVGAPFEDVGALDSAGAVVVLFGSSGGLSSSGNQFWTQNSGSVLEGSEANDLFGWSLASTNLGSGPQDDLAIGAPGETLGGVVAVGAVHVLYGSSDGPSDAADQLWFQNAAGVLETGETGDRFGKALAAANFGNGSPADLAVGVPGETVDGIGGAGAVNVLYGSTGGLTASGDQVWHQNSPGPVLSTALGGESFGAALAAGNLGNGSRADLAVGVPFEESGTLPYGAGAVNVFYGSSTGLTAAGNQYWHQNSSGIADSADGPDRFGASVAVAGFGNGSLLDLAIGAPFEGVGPSEIFSAGAVHVIYGSTGGLTATGSQFWTQESSGVLDASEAGDGFGGALAGA